MGSNFELTERAAFTVGRNALGTGGGTAVAGHPAAFQLHGNLVNQFLSRRRANLGEAVVVTAANS